MRTWRYHKDHPKGRIFDTRRDDMAALEDAGWVDTPAKLVEAETDATGADDNDRQAALLEEAKALRIKGVRANMTAETLEEKIADHRAASGGAE